MLTDEGEEGPDEFYYYFEIELNDADTAQPITARLQQGDSRGGDWQDVAENTVTFSGEDSVWNGEMVYDAYSGDEDNRLGYLHQMRIVCDYTLTDGTAGTLYSTDSGTLYSYRGEYLRGESAELADGVLTAGFRVDTDLVLDPGKAEPTELTLWTGGKYWDILGKAEVSEASADGTVTVTYTLDGEDLDPTLDGSVVLKLLYEDEDGKIAWESSGYVNFDVPVTYVAPGFTELYTERDYNPGIDDEYTEAFYYGFTLELNEADRDQPVTVRLEYYDKENDTWNDCPDRGDTERTRTYSGSDEPWEDYLCYDVLDLDTGNERGRLWQVRIACDYTLPDGSQGTVYSTDCSELYAFKGEYVEAVSATLENDVLTAVFRVDTDVLLDTSPDKLTVSQMSLSGGSGFYHWWDLTDKATISPAAEDGTITVTYTLTDEEVDLSETLRAGLALRYNDRDGAIADWESFDAVVVEIPHIAPIIELDPYVYGPYVEGAWYSTLYVKMTLNDLEGGKAVGTLYYDTGNGFEKVPPNPEFEEYEDYTGTVEYGGEDDYGSVEDGVWYVYAPFAIDPPEGGGYLAQAKIVFDITYPDGYTDTIETEIRPIHMGIFIRYNTDYGNNGWELGEVYNPETGATRYTMSFDVTVDDTLVVPEEVEINSHYLRLWKPTTRYEDGEIERFTDDAGTYHILYTYFSDEPFPDGEYWFNPEPYYQIDENNGWSTYNVYFRFIKEMEGQHRAPIMEILDEEMENDPSNYLPVMVTLNDLRGGTATATLYRQNENGRFEPLTGEGASATYDPSEETGSVWTFRLYDEYLEEYDGTGAKDRVKVVLEYTYPDGETGSREQERFIYLGYYAWFTTAAAPVYDPEAGTVTADLIVVDALMDAEDIWFAYKYMYNQDSDETVYDYSWPNGEIIDMGNGTHVIRFTITTGQLEAGRYYMEIGIRYLDDCYGYWNCVAWTEFTVQ